MPAPLPRRVVLGAAVATLLGGCGAARGPGAGTSSDAPTTTPPGGDDDAGVVSEAADLAAALEARVAATVRTHPGLRAELAGLRATHRSVGRTLEAARDGAPEPDVRPRPAAARRAVLDAERAAVTSYADLATRAEGGRLARVLAGAAAGIAQQLAVLAPGGDAPLPPTGALPDAATPSAALAALRTTLAAEHAAVWTLGVVGARVSGAESPDLLAEVEAAYGTHRDRRDALVAAVRAAGSEPEAAAPAYELPDLGAGPAGRRAAVGRLEEGCAATYAFLVANSTDGRRAWAVAALVDAAAGAVRLGRPAAPLPGL